jgi:ATP-dependent Clp protease ATP-binding subunit ClpB
MTSNLGSDNIQRYFEKMDNMVAGERDEKKVEMHAAMLNILKGHFRPEFLNRIDEIIIFEPLHQKEIEAIVRLQIAQVNKHLLENGTNLQVTDAAVSYLAQAGFDAEFGARPVKRAIQRDLLNTLSRTILEGKLQKDVPIVADLRDGQIVFGNAE